MGLSAAKRSLWINPASRSALEGSISDLCKKVIFAGSPITSANRAASLSVNEGTGTGTTGAARAMAGPGGSGAP